jgi:hypothetical protein
MIKTFFAPFRWALGEIWEKINLPAVYKELKKLGKKYGARFFWAALIWELIEDVLFPYLSWRFGVPELIPLFLIFHFEPIAYPVIFWGFKTYDRMRGREPRDPARPVSSTNWRSVAKVAMYKVAMYKVAITGWFVAILLGLGLSPLVLSIYICLMGLFGYVHERIWNDTNYGIRDDDTVMFKRTWAKATTYRIVSTMTMYPLLKAVLGHMPWLALIGCQVAGYVLYLTLEALWSQSNWGVQENNNIKVVDCA